MGNGSTTTVILNLGIGWRRFSALRLRPLYVMDISLGPIGQKSDWNPELLCAIGRVQFLTLGGYRTPACGRPAHSLVTTQTELFGFSQ
jgi:hypothetical protein